MNVGKEDQIQSLVTILKRFHKHKGNTKGNIIKGNIKRPNDQCKKNQIKKQYQPINSVRLYQQSAKNKTQANNDEIKKILCVQQPQQDIISHKNSVFLFDTINNKSKNIPPRTDLTQKQIVMGEHARRYGIFYRQNGHQNDKGKHIQNDSFLCTHKPRIKSQVTESIFQKKSKQFKNLGASPFSNSVLKSPKNSPNINESQYSGKYSKPKKNKSPLTPTLAQMLSVPLGLIKSSTPGLNRYSPLNSQLRMNNYQKYCESIYQKYRDKSNQRLQKSYKISEQPFRSKNTKVLYTQQHKKTIERNKRKIKIWQLNQNPLEKIKYIDLTKRSSKKAADQWLKNGKQQKDVKNQEQVFVDSFNASQLKPMLSQKEQTVSQTIKQKLNKRYERVTPKLYTEMPSDSMIKNKNKTQKAGDKNIYIETEIKLEGWQQNRRNNLPNVGKINYEGSRANSTSLDQNYYMEPIKNPLFC